MNAASYRETHILSCVFVRILQAWLQISACMRLRSLWRSRRQFSGFMNKTSMSVSVCSRYVERESPCGLLFQGFGHLNKYSVTVTMTVIADGVSVRCCLMTISTLIAPSFVVDHKILFTINSKIVLSLAFLFQKPEYLAVK
jgi:hypothetical protein